MKKLRYWYFIMSLSLIANGSMGSIFDHHLHTEEVNKDLSFRLIHSPGTITCDQDQEGLWQVVKGHNLYDSFGTQETHTKLLYDWVLRFRALTILSSGSTEASQQLQENKDWIEAIKANYDIYADEYNSDPMVYLKGVWALQAVFDPEERSGLINALSTGMLGQEDQENDPDSLRLFPKDRSMAALFRSFFR